MKFKDKLSVMAISTAALVGCGGGGGGDDPQSNDPVREPQITSLHALSDIAIGAAVPASHFDAFDNGIDLRPNLQDVVVQHFNQITAENIMKPSYLQPAQGQFEWQWADALVDWAGQHGLSVHGHTLLWHQQLPAWMEGFNGDSLAWLSMMQAHIEGVAGHFGTRIATWDVVNEALSDCDDANDTAAHCLGHQASYPYRNSLWYQHIGPRYIADAFHAAHAAAPHASLYYNDYNLSANTTKLTATLSMLNDLLDAGVPVHGVGMQMHVTQTWPSIDNIRGAFSQAAATGLMVKITELDVRLNENGSLRGLSAELAEQQLARYQAIVAAYLSEVPPAQQGGVSVWGVSDADSWIPHQYGSPDWPLPFDQQLKQKPALEGMAQALQQAE